MKSGLKSQESPEPDLSSLKSGLKPLEIFESLKSLKSLKSLELLKSDPKSGVYKPKKSTWWAKWGRYKRCNEKARVKILISGK